MGTMWWFWCCPNSKSWKSWIISLKWASAMFYMKASGCIVGLEIDCLHGVPLYWANIPLDLVVFET